MCITNVVRIAARHFPTNPYFCKKTIPMRRISADYIFPIASKPVKNGIITIDADGRIISIDNSSGDESIAGTEHYEGIICPGFINTHCHLELSHFYRQISERAGMTGFIRQLLSRRPHFTKEEIEEGIQKGEAEMIRNGIVAVGDISNDNSTFGQKRRGNLVYQTFIEAFDLNPKRAGEVFMQAMQLKAEHNQFSSRASIVPHAPYTVSPELFAFIKAEAEKTNSIISYHSQESLAESELFISRSGAMYDAFTNIGIDMSFVPETGENSLRSTFERLPLSQKILLVHNTFTSAEDVRWAESKRQEARGKRQEGATRLETQNSNLFWCTCPNANLFIENTLPDYSVFIETGAQVTIGTDSLASNWSLSILDELKTIAKHDPSISLQTLLTWATKNGAAFLGLDELGTIEKGKKPGLNWLKNVEGMRILDRTEVVKLV